MDASNDVNASLEQPGSPELESPRSLFEALTQLAFALQQNNQLLMQIVEQNQMLMAAMVEPDDAEPREDMEGRPIRDS